MWNGPIECRMFRFDMVKGKLKPEPEGTQELQKSLGHQEPGAETH
jgi:hypothetical protein